jgi:stage V sporulation protein G
VQAVQITEVKIFKKENRDKKLRAFATITFDDSFVVRDLKVIEGNKGLFVAMPSRRIKEPCPSCGHRNVVRSKFCNNCGKQLDPNVTVSRENEHKDIAHPITLECREMVQKAVLEAFDKEINSAGPAEQTVSGSNAPGDEDSSE